MPSPRSQELVPEWKSTSVALAGLTPVPPSLEPDVRAVVNYMSLREQHWEALLNAERQTKGRDWLHSADKSPDKEEIERMAHIGSEYIHAEVDLEFAKPDASARGDKLRRLQDLAARVKALDDREHNEDMRLDFDDFSAFLERDQLPEWRDIEQRLADLSPLPAALEQDVTAIMNHMRLKQDGWEARVAYQHYEQDAKVVDEKRSVADDAARAIRHTSGVRLLVPY